MEEYAYCDAGLLHLEESRCHHASYCSDFELQESLTTMVLQNYQLAMEVYLLKTAEWIISPHSGEIEGFDMKRLPSAEAVSNVY